MTKTEKIAHLTKQLNEWTAMLQKSRKHSLMCMRVTHVSYLQNALAKLRAAKLGPKATRIRQTITNMNPSF